MLESELNKFRPREETGRSIVGNREGLEFIEESGRDYLGEAVNGNFADLPKAARRGLRMIESATTPFGVWIEDYCKRHQITLTNLAHSVQYSNLRGQIRDRISVKGMLGAFRRLPEAQSLTGEEVEGLRGAIVQTIVQRVENGEKFSGSRIRSIQRDLQYTIYYNGREAADVLGVSPQWVYQLMAEFGLPRLMMSADVAKLRERLESSREQRERDYSKLL